MKAKNIREMNTRSSFAQTFDSSHVSQLASHKASLEKIQQLTSKHYNQAMKYIYRKNQQEQKIKLKDMIQPQLTAQFTFKPKILRNKYNIKIKRDQGKTKSQKNIQLNKWGTNHSYIKRQNIVANEASSLNRSVEIQHLRSQERIQRERSRSAKSKKKAEDIPGVKKFYLKQARGLAAQYNEVLKYRGDEKTGYTFF